MMPDRKIMPAPMPTMTLPLIDGGEAQLGGGRWQVAIDCPGRHCLLYRQHLKTLDSLPGTVSLTSRTPRSRVPIARASRTV